MNKPKSAAALQTAALGVIVFVIGVAGSVEHSRMDLVPGAVLMFALMILAGALVYVSYQVEEVERLDIYDAETGTDAITRGVIEAYQLMSPKEQEKFLQDFAALREKKAALDADTSKAANRKAALKNHLHHTRREGQCQV